MRYYLRQTSWFIIGLVIVAVASQAVAGPQPGWQREEVDWRITGGQRIRAVRYPQDAPLRMRAAHPGAPRPRIYRKALGPEAAGRVTVISKRADKRASAAVVAAAAGAPIYATVIDSPPTDGFVPWIAVVVTDESLGELEMDAVPSSSVVGDYLVPNPEQDYAIGLLDTGASAHVMGNEAATGLGLFSASPDFITPYTVTISGVTGSVDAWVSMPLGLFVDGLGAVDPDTLILDTSNMVGESNVSIGVGQTVQPPQPDLPTAIGSPLAVYFASAVNNRMTQTISRDGDDYTAPDIQFYETDDPAIPEYPNFVPLELRPLGSTSVQYVPCFFDCPGGVFVPQSPSVIIGNLSQSLFFIGSGVDLTDNGNSAIDKDRFMIDTGAQVTVVGYRVGSRLGLDPDDPDFTVEIIGVTGDISIEPGFYIDTLEIPALGDWLSYTNVPVVLLEVASPEGGTLDGIIGMNLFLQYDFVLRGGGLFGQDAPSLELQLILPIDVDYDDDGDVDQEDFGHFQVCLSGMDVPQTDPNCADALLDSDSDVDADDFALFQTCLSGPGNTADPNCTQ